MSKKPPLPVPVKTEVQSISIAALSRDPAYQVRKKLDEPTVRRYVGVYTSGKAMPPVKIAKVNGVPVLVDGWHRVAALEHIGATDVDAEVSTMTQSDAIWAAASANMEHGKPLAKSEVREVYKRYMRTKQYKKVDGSLKSYRDIGRELGQGHTTIRNWELKHFPATARARGMGETQPRYEPVDTVSDRGELREAEQAMTALAAAFSKSSDPGVRGDIVERVSQLLATLKDAGNWDEPMF